MKVRNIKKTIWLSYLIVSVLTVSSVAFTIVVPRTANAKEFPVSNVTELINAINAVNDETTNPGLDTIILGAFGTYALNVAVDLNDGHNGLPSITSELTINGNGATINRSSSAASSFRIFHVASGGNLILKDLTVRNGKTRFGDSITLRGFGGGILNNAGRLKLINCTVIGNKAPTVGNGGGISNEKGTVELINSTISGNVADWGGGVYNSGTMKLINCTVSHNHAVGVPVPCIGGGRSAGFGGGIVAIGGSVELTNCTISSNKADFGSGCSGPGNPVGGIDIRGGKVITRNTIVAKQLKGTDCGNNFITSKGYNLDSDGTCGFTGDGDLQNTDPQLEKFLNVVLTTGRGHFPLQKNSPAIDAGNNAFCPINDQLHMPRPLQGKENSTVICDIGAIEYYPIVDKDMVDLEALDYFFSTTPVPPYATAGTLNITATFRNTSGKTILHPFFEVIKFSHGVVLNTVGGSVGATLTPYVGSDGEFSDNESITVKFIIGLEKIQFLRFFVYLRGGIY
ncbi:MAG: hypothetical protein D8M57_04875 [Candidatus Scalindua sp. AMX11]|nr:MAG: hypothetical protein DWQ00_03720 [Candidatus Scalindua sp.]NOG84553.1 hypothetical protein [Planctomycetota bacterium]RZV92328.1 MAG: hypothetical protein EX341_04580 [Candidatus Scalindua sp. SCAELEC01]TDE66148.1 MAG: hypothetical protein D8M57_04875 [Candidatus Scalindua sp. AMX11]GJQ59122.1 MAG: hypothetical protein SCALA701_19230 [Candidatus Scalindua sp.]